MNERERLYYYIKDALNEIEDIMNETANEIAYKTGKVKEMLEEMKGLEKKK